MKLRNPSCRNDLFIQKKYKVLEVGGGNNPHPRSNVVVDKYIDNNYHRRGDLKVYSNQQFVCADGVSKVIIGKAEDLQLLIKGTSGTTIINE